MEMKLSTFHFIILLDFLVIDVTNQLFWQSNQHTSVCRLLCTNDSNCEGDNPLNQCTRADPGSRYPWEL